MTSSEGLFEKIEVLSINDYEAEPNDPVMPQEGKILDDIIAIWKEDPSTESLGSGKLYNILKNRHPAWSLSEKRFKQLLKDLGLLSCSSIQQYTYSNSVVSSPTPHLEVPSSIRIQYSNDSLKGKSLVAIKKIKKDELIWEETPLFFIPPLANLNLIRLGKACSGCGKLLTKFSRANIGLSLVNGLDCNICSEVWCNQSCKRNDVHLHGLLKHNVYNNNNSLQSKKAINANSFLELQDMCFSLQWNALYAISLIYANIQLDKTNMKNDQFNSLAKVRQDIRYKALSSSAGAFDNLQGGTYYERDEQEDLWIKGYNQFLDTFPKSAENSEISYEDFMFMLGAYNINNFDSNIFLLESHVNHDCNPNIKVVVSESREEGIKVYAIRDIEVGEELTRSYVNVSNTVQQRQRQLRVNWGFLCSCLKCKEDLKIQQRRKSSTTTQPKETKNEIREMLSSIKSEIGEEGIELEVPLDYNGERRKSVRFDEKVIAVKK